MFITRCVFITLLPSLSHSVNRTLTSTETNATVSKHSNKSKTKQRASSCINRSAFHILLPVEVEVRRIHEAVYSGIYLENNSRKLRLNLKDKFLAQTCLYCTFFLKHVNTLILI